MNQLTNELYLLPALLGVLAGAASMMLYRRVSPQLRLLALQDEIATLQQAMAAFDGDFSGAMALTRQNLRLAFCRLGMVLWPALVSSLPVFAVLPLVGHAYIPYCLCVTVAALTVKFVGKIA
jgi:hypothetical protein